MMRVEYGSDPWVNAPCCLGWEHAGHAIVIDSFNTTRIGKSSAGSVEYVPGHVNAYKFGVNYPFTGGVLGSASGKLKCTAKIKCRIIKQEKHHDHDITTYIDAMDQIAQLGVQWPKHYVGDVGNGVKGLNNEKRLVV